MLDAKRLTLEVYPNPAKSYLVIRWTSTRFGQTADRQSALGGLKIFDVSGKVVRSVELNKSKSQKEPEVRIFLKGINSGIYFIRLKTVKNEAMKKVVIF